MIKCVMQSVFLYKNKTLVGADVTIMLLLCYQILAIQKHRKSFNRKVTCIFENALQKYSNKLKTPGMSEEAWDNFMAINNLNILKDFNVHLQLLIHNIIPFYSANNIKIEGQ